MPASRPAPLAPFAIPRLVVTPSSPVLPMYDPSASSSPCTSYFSYPAHLPSPQDARYLSAPTPWAATRRRPARAATYAPAAAWPGKARRARRSATASLALAMLALILVLTAALAPGSVIARASRTAATFDARPAHANLYTYRAVAGVGRWAPAWSDPADAAPLVVPHSRGQGGQGAQRAARIGPRAVWRGIVDEVQRGGHAFDAWDFH